jgi:hypothetical protein
MRKSPRNSRENYRGPHRSASTARFPGITAELTDPQVPRDPKTLPRNPPTRRKPTAAKSQTPKLRAEKLRKTPQQRYKREPAGGARGEAGDAAPQKAAREKLKETTPPRKKTKKISPNPPHRAEHR